MLSQAGGVLNRLLAPCGRRAGAGRAPDQTERFNSDPRGSICIGVAWDPAGGRTCVCGAAACGAAAAARRLRFTQAGGDADGNAVGAVEKAERELVASMRSMVHHIG